MTGESKGNQEKFWKAINIARNREAKDSIPNKMHYKEKTSTSGFETAELFAETFIDKLEATGEICKTVYNGQRILNNVTETPFTPEEVSKVLKKLNTPTVSAIQSAYEITPRFQKKLLNTVTDLFNKIYKGKQIPEVWRISRIIPLHKKGNRTETTNYRPISNLCSLEKVYERCLLNRLERYAEESGSDLTGRNQYGFKKSRSTTTISLVLQSKLAKLSKEKAAMLSLDLTAAFDVVNHELLMKRLEILGVPPTLLKLLKTG